MRITLPSSIGIILLGLVFFGCEKDATIPPPKADKKLVIVCFISPDEDTLKARVTFSNPIFGSSSSVNEVVKNATVQIKGPDGNATFVYDPVLEEYILPQTAINLKPGTEYQVTAQNPSGYRASGRCKIPNRFDTGFEALVTDSIVTFENEFGKYYSYRFQVRFTPKSPEKSWFRVGAYQKLYNDNVFDKKEYWAVMSYDLDSRFFISEQPQVNPFVAFINIPDFYEYNQDSVKVFRFFLIQGDKTYYDFHQSLNSYEGDNPFAEPVRLYTNIEGGLGVVASYLMTSKTIVKP